MLFPALGKSFAGVLLAFKGLVFSVGETVDLFGALGPTVINAGLVANPNDVILFLSQSLRPNQIKMMSR